MNRRRFIVTGLGATGALVVGWGLLPPRQRLYASDPLAVRDDEVALNGWVKIAADDTVTVIMAKQEMGQGIHTAAAMLLAEELDCEWGRIRVEPAPLDRIYGATAVVLEGLPLHPDDQGVTRQLLEWIVPKVMRELGLMMTGGSSSVRDLWQPMREAGAIARATLLAAAARAWRVPVAECSVENSVIRHRAGHSIGFGSLVAGRPEFVPPAAVRLKAAGAFHLLGTPVPRLDAAAKSRGASEFSLDVRPAGLMHAAVRMCPSLGGGVGSFDPHGALAIPGVRRVIAVSAAHGTTAGVAAIATDSYAARRAVDQVVVEWTAGAARGLSSETVEHRLREALREANAHTFHERGDVDRALSSAARRVSSEYWAPYLAHATMEPMNCTVRVDPDAATVWLGTQVPGLARDAVARVLGVSKDRVTLHVLAMGGGFGRRLEVDYVAQAAAIAREMPGQPVSTLWSREEDLRHDVYRPACLVRLEGGLDGTGRLTALRSVSAGQAIAPGYTTRNLGFTAAGPDRASAEGAFDQAYEIEHERIAHAALELPVPVGYWRSVGHSHQAFFIESFLDELAAAAGVDPVAFRRLLLAKHTRHRAVLDLVAQKSDWHSPLEPAAGGTRRARGIALHQSFGSIVALVAEVALPADGAMRVERVVCAADCGFVVNPRIAAQQLEGSVVFGLSAALHGEITLVDGAVMQGNFSDYPLLRMADCPRIETHLVDSDLPPTGLGEPGVPPVAPAVANALFALTGARQRRLPLRPPATGVRGPETTTGIRP